MIEVNAALGDGYLSLQVTGHEGHAEQGRVCAAVSAITQTALLGLEELARQYPDLVRVEITPKE